MAEERVTARQRAILTTAVARYIATGEPVSSGAIAAALGDTVESGVGPLSSATVRNELVALAEAGWLEQPHTSAGRVPTARAFRLYVESFQAEQARAASDPPARALLQQTRDAIDARFLDVAGTQAVLERTSHVLAALSSGVGVAIAALPEGEHLEHVHFSRLAPARILAVVVTRGGLVRDRVLALEHDLTHVELETAGNFLNENFRGWEIERIRAELRARVEREQRELHRLLLAVEQLWSGAVPVETPGTHAGFSQTGFGQTGFGPAGFGQTVFVEGVANLVGSQPLGGAADRERLREMLHALATKQRLVELLNAYVDARQGSVRVVFDLEEQAPEMAGLVLIAAPARLAGERRGTVGVIGPKRMEYERTIDAVRYIAQVLERQDLAGRG